MTNSARHRLRKIQCTVTHSHDDPDPQVTDENKNEMLFAIAKRMLLEDWQAQLVFGLVSFCAVMPIIMGLQKKRKAWAKERAAAAKKGAMRKKSPSPMKKKTD